MTDPIAIHADLIAGRRRAVAWGAGGLTPYLLLQAPYRFAAIVDSSAPADGSARVAGLSLLPPEALAAMDPQHTAIVCFADMDRFGAQIAAQVAGYGPFPLVAPFLAARDGPALAATPFEARLRRLRIDRGLRRLLAEARRTGGAAPAGSRRAVLWVHQICKGGAERQICLLAVALRRRGWEVHLVTALADAPRTESLAALLAGAGVGRIVLPDPRAAWDDVLRDGPLRRRAEALAPYFVAKHLHRIVVTTELLNALKPELLVSYLDDGNLVAGVAGTLAAVPRILLSARNFQPNELTELVDFPVEKERLAAVYRALLRLAGARLSANSSLGAKSYERWLGLACGSIPVVHNAVVAAEGDGLGLRASLGIPPSAPLALGIMRVVPQKQPLVFVDVMARVLRDNASAHAMLVGDGPLAEAVKTAVKDSGVGERFHLLGTRDDTATCLDAADLLLITSRVEGLPNVALEAQVQGRAVVATDAGGTREALAANLQPLVCPVGDVDALATVCAGVMADRAGLRALGDAARREIGGLFGMEALACGTLAAAGLAVNQRECVAPARVPG